ncbi:hypothetical protein HY384_03830 [Candidatus Daviesbacteria bacterium]|nr:hypothetical protein [Candidatus Daviesbacteria bacterium]
MSIELGATIPANEIGMGLPVESVIPVSGLRPPVLNGNGEIAVDGRTNQFLEGNLEDKMPEIAEIIAKRYHWVSRLAEEVRQHKKSAIVVAALGGLTILSAVGAGFEFGVRHGEDIRTFYDRLNFRLRR